METFKRIYIRGIAIIMAALIAVSTPISDFADIKGMKQTEAAAAGALISLGSLFGGIAAAYGLYISKDKINDMLQDWITWTDTNNSEAFSQIQTIRDGVTSIIIKKTLVKSVVDYLATRVSDSYTYQQKGVAQFYSTFTADRLNNQWHTDFLTLVARDAVAEFAGYELVYYQWRKSNSSGFPSGNYSVTMLDSVEVDKVRNAVDVVYTITATYTNSKGSCHYPVFIGFDADGKYVAHTSKGIKASGYYVDSSKEWDFSVSESPDTVYFYDSDFTNYQHAFYVPTYMTSFQSFSKVRTLDEWKNNVTVNKDLVIDYTTHGSSALDNADALTGKEVTEEKLTQLMDVSSEEFQKYLESQNNNENNEEPDISSLSTAISLAVLSTLQNMGYIKNPTDEPSGENVKEQLGNIQISLDGLIDAISQINPAQGLANIAQGIAELPQKITASVTDAIRNVFEDLFVPDEGAIQDKVDEITDKFAFADSLLTVVDDIGGALKNASGPPEIYIHFEDAEDSKYTSIGTLKLLSFEWYERYKPYGDALLSSMLWLFFLWKVRKRISEIVQGLSVSGESDANASANPAIGTERGRSS